MDVLNLAFKRWILAVVLSVLVGQSHANGLALSEYVADVISAHPRVRAQVHIFRQALRDQDIAKSGWRPSIDLEASSGNFDSESPTVGLQPIDYSSNRAELSITQNLFNGLDTRYRQKQTKARARSALFELYDTADNIALDAVQVYLEVLKHKRLLALAEDNLASHEETLTKIRKRSNSGAGRRSQLEQTEGRVARARASLIAQQNNLEDALTGMHEILGRYVQATQLTLPISPIRPGENLNRLTDQALIQHPALKVANYNIEAAREDQRRSESTHYPKIDLRLAKTVGDDLNGIPGETDETSVVLNLEYNFYRGGSDRAEQSKKISVVHEQQQFAARVRRQIINTLRLAWVADQSLNEQLKYLKKHVDKSKETMISYREEFFIGQRDLIDLLDSKNELNSAQSNYTEAYFEAIAARFRIYEGMGELFNVLKLNASIENDDLRVSRVQAYGEDVLPLDLDIDKDQELDKSDHCDNSLEKSVVNFYGCVMQAKVKIERTNIPRGNIAPKATDDQWELEQNGVLIFTQAMLLKNDMDADGDRLRIEKFTQPKIGKLARNSKRNLIYRAAEGFVGVDTFTYTLIDRKGDTDIATVKVVVSAENDISLKKTHYVNFIFGKAELTEASRDKIKLIVRKLKANPNIKSDVYTFTDNIGSDKYNLKLSERRAQVVQALLLSSGISADKITAIGKGENEPIANNSTKEGQAINRRGEFVFTPQD